MPDHRHDSMVTARRQATLWAQAATLHLHAGNLQQGIHALGRAESEAVTALRLERELAEKKAQP